jgi:uncharacterized protein YjiS (DUF1127 family)
MRKSPYSTRPLLERPLAETWPPANMQAAWYFPDLEVRARANRVAVIRRLARWSLRKARAEGIRLLRLYRAWQEACATRRALQLLDDRALADLGFTRHEVDSVVAELQGRAERTRRIAMSSHARHGPSK